MKYARHFFSTTILTAAVLALGAGAAEPAAPNVDANAKIKALEDQVKVLEKRVAELEAQNKPAADIAPKRLNRQRDAINQMMERMRQEMENGGGGIFNGQPFIMDDEFGLMPQAGNKPRLGVMLDEVRDELKTRFKNDVKSGAFVMTVVPNSPAAKAGIAVGDAITSFDGKAIATPKELIDAVKNATKGTHELAVSRHGEALMLKVDLANEETAAVEEFLPFGNGNADAATRTELKVSALELPDSLAKDLKLSDDQHKKMDEILAKHAKALSEEFQKSQPAHPRGMHNFSMNGDLTELAKKHADNAAKDLAGVLNDEQLKKWNDYRSTHSSVSFSTSTQMGTHGGGLKPEPDDQKGFSF
ncbi:MAG TPA: PDZ domain-containing protein [Planctomycetota bacterium]|nr:PDZ domain-containing protein [Planctomycetota bacterium]